MSPPGWLLPSKGRLLSRGLRGRGRWGDSWLCMGAGKVPTEVPCPVPWPNGTICSLATSYWSSAQGGRGH